MSRNQNSASRPFPANQGPTKRTKRNNADVSTAEAFKQDYDRVNSFHTTYSELLGTNSSQMTSINVQKHLGKCTDILTEIDNGTMTLNVAVVGETCNGKSWLVNKLSQNTSRVLLLSEGSLSNENVDRNVSTANTIFTTKVTHKDEENYEVLQWNNENEPQLLHEKANLNEIANHLRASTTSEDSQYMEVTGSFPQLKLLNISVYDTPGLEDKDFQDKVFTIRKRTHVLLIVCKDGRGSVKESVIRNLEPFLEKPIAELPVIIVLHNDDSQSLRQFRIDDTAKQRFMNAFRNCFGNMNVLPSVVGKQRELLFSELPSRIYGMCIGKVATTEDLDLKNLKTTMDEIREKIIKQRIKPGQLYLLQAAYLLRKNLQTTSFQKQVREQFKPMIDKLDKMRLTTYKKQTEHWKLQLDYLMDKIETEECLKYVKPKRNRYADLKEELFKPSELRIVYEWIVKQQAQYVMEECLQGLSSQSGKDIEWINTATGDSDETPDSTTFASASREMNSLAEKYKQLVQIPNPQNSVESYLAEFISETRQDIVNELISDDGAAIHLCMVEALRDNLVAKNIIAKEGEVDVTRKDELNMVSHVLYKVVSRKGQIQTVRDLLVGNYLIEEVIGELQRVQVDCPGSQEQYTQLKGDISKWFNVERYIGQKAIEDTEIIWETYQQMKEVHDQEWNEYTGKELDDNLDDSYNKMTKIIHKRLKTRQKTIMEQKERPATDYFKNSDLDYDSFELKQIEKEKMKTIAIRFKDDDPTTKVLCIDYYPDWLTDLVTLLTREDKMVIYPKFFPSRGRHSVLANSLFFHKSKTGENRSKFAGLSYIVVERPEVNNYFNLLKRLDRNDIVFVILPKVSRGIAFSRSIIKILQEVMRRQLLKQHRIPFNWFWMIDDDVQSIYMFTTQSKSCQMSVKCSAETALFETQKKICSKIGCWDEILADREGSCIQSLLDLNFEDTLSNLVPRTIARKLFYNKECYIPFLKLVQACNVDGMLKLLKDMKVVEVDSKNLKDWMTDFYNAAEIQVGKNCKYAQVALAKHGNNMRDNYNMVAHQQQYKVSEELHACTLSFAPGLFGYNYLPDHYLFAKDDDVNNERKIHLQECANLPVRKKAMTDIYMKLSNKKKALQATSNLEEIKKINNEQSPEYELRHYFLGEDKKLSQRLTMDNRAGYQVYFFSVEYGRQRTGGCFRMFRTTNMY